MYRFLNVESYALFPGRENIKPALIITRVDIAWAARYPTWLREIYPFGNRPYFVYPEGTLSEGEKRYKQILDDSERCAPTAGEVIVKALKRKGLERARIGLDEKNLPFDTRTDRGRITPCQDNGCLRAVPGDSLNPEC